MLCVNIRQVYENTLLSQFPTDGNDQEKGRKQEGEEKEGEEGREKEGREGREKRERKEIDNSTVQLYGFWITTN